VLLTAVLSPGAQAERTAEKGGSMTTLEWPVIEGEITQIDYDKQHRITVIHVAEPGGKRNCEIRFTYPEFMTDVRPDQNPYVILRRQERPEVSVVRLA
jgi:hypothetical protein